MKNNICMKQLAVNIFEGTSVINIPKDISYVEMVTYKGTPYYYFMNIEDSTMFKIISNPSYNTILLKRENFSADMFPLTITTFDDDDFVLPESHIANSFKAKRNRKKRRKKKKSQNVIAFIAVWQNFACLFFSS